MNYTEEVALITNETYIKKHIIENTKLFRLLYADIDAGESEALVLALEQKADLILLDDQEARIKARKLNLPVTGTLGVLLKAKNQGLIRSLKTEIQTLQASGFWLSQEIVDAFLSHSTSRG
ncbi:MAG: DUF3368 domain-containing protein [Deltaproteobacteria bacterium]|nr:DUF3368 domain-containing protein [Deltaproteobacteria bacterium]